MKYWISGFMLWMVLVVQGQAGDNNCNAFLPPDTMRFQSLHIDTIADISQLPNIEVEDTFYKPFGMVFYAGDEYIGLQKNGYWIYWKIADRGGVQYSGGKYGIYRQDINGGKSAELVLKIEYSDGRYQRFGGFSEKGYTLQAYDLDKLQLLLQLPVYYHYETSTMHYTDAEGNKVETEQELEQYEAEDKLESLTYVAETDSQTYSCAYSFSKGVLNLECTCVAKSEIDGEATFHSVDSFSYAIKPGMILRKRLK